MKLIQQWFVTAALASIGVILALIIVSAQMSSADSNQSETPPVLSTDAPPAVTLAPTVTNPPPPTPTPQLEHVVQRGELLSQIASLHCLKWEELAAYNGLADANSLKIGQILRIPSTC